MKRVAVIAALGMLMGVSGLALGSTSQAATGQARPQRAKPLMIVNGPIVEFVNQNSAVIAWTTNSGGSTIVQYGTDPNSLSQRAQAPYADREGVSYQTHRVTLRNLKPATKYYYVAHSGQGEDTGTAAKTEVSSFVTAGGNAATPATLTKVPLYRLVSLSGPEHFYTTSKAEADAQSQTMRLEGPAGYVLSAPAPGAVPLYRLQAPGNSDAHFYTTNAGERDHAVSQGLKSEGTAGFVAESQMPDTSAFYRLYNSATGDHFYTTNADEKAQAVKNGYKYEGLAGYVWTSQ